MPEENDVEGAQDYGKKARSAGRPKQSSRPKPPERDEDAVSEDVISKSKRLVRTEEGRWWRSIGRLGPYQSLALLAVPVCLVEPLKLLALAVAGDGHWLTGTAMIIAAYAVSLLVIERLFVIVRPQLLTLRWFAKLWTWFAGLRRKTIRPFGGV
ncbi:MAG TPA: hypothetical protein VKR55_05990 [Bradyrhizobium sp.]|uniref:hypothetical protein n=1 Tax=Bradyrhizobium sp. TaxID=376 RepID=UPI002D1E2327|nr:hypothetical protein [Bradyrhizobium sp.]HLZ01690.1 hypothetical protein [Bradyrhizobium sp.]